MSENTPSIGKILWRMICHPHQCASKLMEMEISGNIVDVTVGRNLELNRELMEQSNRMQLLLEENDRLKHLNKEQSDNIERLKQEVSYLESELRSQRQMDEIMSDIEHKLQKATKMKRSYELKVTNLQLRLDDALGKLRQADSKIQHLKSVSRNNSLKSDCSDQLSGYKSGKTLDVPKRETGKHDKDGNDWFIPLPDSI